MACRSPAEMLCVATARENPGDVTAWLGTPPAMLPPASAAAGCTNRLLLLLLLLPPCRARASGLPAGGQQLLPPQLLLLLAVKAERASAGGRSLTSITRRRASRVSDAGSADSGSTSLPTPLWRSATACAC
jgi:hypothetical protein